jgi:hypothetical protein
VVAACTCAWAAGPLVVAPDAALGASSISYGSSSRVNESHAPSSRPRGIRVSEAGPMPRTAGRIADELHAPLARGSRRIWSSDIRTAVP